MGDGKRGREITIDVDMIFDAANDKGFDLEVFEDAADIHMETRLPLSINQAFAVGGGPDVMNARA